MDTAVSSAASTAAAMASAVTASPTTVTSSDKGTTSAGSSVTVMTPSSLPSMPKFSAHTGDSSSLTLSETSVAAVPPGSVRPHFVPVGSYQSSATGFLSSMSHDHPRMSQYMPSMDGHSSPSMGPWSGTPHYAVMGGHGHSGTVGHPSTMSGMRSGAESPTPTETGSLSREEKSASFVQGSLLGLGEDTSSSLISKIETKATAHSDATSLTPMDYSSFETPESFTAEEPPAQPFNDVRLPREMETDFNNQRKEVTVNHENRLKELNKHYEEAMTENKTKTEEAHKEVNRDIETGQETVNTLKEKVATLLKQLDPFPKGPQDADYEPPQFNESQLEDLRAQLRDARRELRDAKVKLAFERFYKDKINIDSELQEDRLSDEKNLTVKAFEGDKQRGLDNIDNERARAQRAILDEQTAERNSETSVRERASTETLTKASLESPPPITEEVVSEDAGSSVKTDTSATKSSWGGLGLGSLFNSLPNPFKGAPEADYTDLEATLSEEVIKSGDETPTGDGATSTDSTQWGDIQARLDKVESNQQAIRDSGRVLDDRKALTAKLERDFAPKDDTTPGGDGDMTKL